MKTRLGTSSAAFTCGNFYKRKQEDASLPRKQMEKVECGVSCSFSVIHIIGEKIDMRIMFIGCDF